MAATTQRKPTGAFRWAFFTFRERIREMPIKGITGAGPPGSSKSSNWGSNHNPSIQPGFRSWYTGPEEQRGENRLAADHSRIQERHIPARRSRGPHRRVVHSRRIRRTLRSCNRHSRNCFPIVRSDKPEPHAPDRGRCPWRAGQSTRRRRPKPCEPRGRVITRPASSKECGEAT